MSELIQECIFHPKWIHGPLPYNLYGSPYLSLEPARKYSAFYSTGLPSQNIGPKYHRDLSA